MFPTPSSLNLTHRDEESQTWDQLTRRRFLKGTLLSGLGAAALGLSPAAFAKAFVTGKTAADIRGAGVDPGQVRLNQNENPLGASPKALEAIRKMLPNCNRYMNSYPFELVFKLNKLAGMSMDGVGMNPQSREEWDTFQKKNHIFLADGSGSILKAAVFAILDKGGHLVEAENGYGDVSEFAQDLQQRGRNVTITRVPLTPDKRHDLDAMRKAVTSETKLVVITNPNNPTGTIVPHEAIVKFVESVPESVKILIDEAYIDFVRDPNYVTATDLALSKPNVFVTRTFSKVYGLPAVRLGYAVGKNPNFEGFWNYIGSWNDMALAAGNAALDDAEHIAASKRVVAEGRVFLEKEFQALGIEYVPSESSFMLFKVSDTDQVTRELQKRSVFIRNAARMWGVNGYCRVSMGTADELDAFVTTLKQVLGKAGI
ncbi:MAG: aminotransferase class I/II-fold pyridoxal phosphate-dependent enzyme [candidate division Zixibacteria bacterium]|nr:aminotransferase class I/II-fold pyridoxal phosphate-dependent enzyme [candidate division Zixibacteria bacterium]